MGPEDKWIAHISSDGRKEPLSRHLEETALKASEFASPFGGGDEAYIAGAMHDIGKASNSFMEKLGGGSIHSDHVTAGAWECFRNGHVAAAMAVLGHHGGLRNGGYAVDSAMTDTFRGRMRRGREDRIEWYQPVEFPKRNGLPGYLREEGEQFTGLFFIRMIFSSLVDADYLMTERFLRKTERKDDWPGMEELLAKATAWTERWSSPDTPLNEERTRILSSCIESGRNTEPGAYELTVPTGSGKTVSGLMWALEHAVRNGKRRIVYVIPYMSVIEQTAEVFREILGEENVLEHHSNADLSSYTGPGTGFFDLCRAQENWDIPVIVTTQVQFFESLYASKPWKCRKLHNLADSVIVMDEVQLLPMSFMAPSLKALFELVRRYGCSSLMTTATMPRVDSIAGRIAPDIPVRNILEGHEIDRSTFDRVTWRYDDEMTEEKLLAEISSSEQALLIVNTRREASDLYGKLSGEGVFHLSTLMYPAHRERVLSEIRKRLAEGKRTLLVSTSMVEAGVDIDFPLVWREISSVPSIIQAAGRCNREGRRPKEESIVTVWKEDWHMGNGGDPVEGASSTVWKKLGVWDSEEAQALYWKALEHIWKEKLYDRKGILELMTREFAPFEKLDRAFRLIDDGMKTVYIPTEESRPLLEEYERNGADRAVMRRLSRYQVRVYGNEYERLVRDGSIKEMKGISVITDPDMYSQETGLRVF